MPKVSVIIPTYNRAELLYQAIASVLSQTYGDFELIIVDDGSTDNTRSVVEGIGDDRIRYIWQENQQRCVARNTGIDAALGDYLAFLDSDDLWLPRKLELQLAALNVHSQARASHGRCIRMGPNLEYIYPQELLVSDDRVRCCDVRETLLVRNIFSSQGVVAHREVFEQAGGFDPALPHGEDWDMWIRLSAFTPFCLVNEPVGIYRVHPGCRTSNPVSTLAGDMIIIEKHRESMTLLMKTKAELYSYAIHAAKAADQSLPEAEEWTMAALERAVEVRDHKAIMDAFVGFAVAGDCSLAEYTSRAGRLKERVAQINSLGGKETVRVWMSSFWLSVAHAFRARGLHYQAAQAALRAMRSGGLRALDRGLLSTGTRSVLSAIGFSKDDASAKREREISDFLRVLLKEEK
ncbi:MAG: glycosyltransferase [Armatimonadetes bacterium]|jgi:hypothetical protein|nr:glycosyltransferase [Armatimonadota bacterium]